MAVDIIACRARVAALEAAGKKHFKGVSGVMEAAEAMETSAKPPWAFCAIASERAQPNRTQGAHDQKVDTVVAVLMCLAAERRDGAVQLTDAAEAARLAVITSFAGWTAPGARTAFDYDGYRVVRMERGLVWLEAAFRASWVLRT